MPREEFVNEAYEYGIDIITASCNEEAIVRLKSPDQIWDAIILDANSKLSRDPNEAPSLESLQEIISYLNTLPSDRFIPWFVYTGGGYEGYQVLDSFIPRKRDWDDRRYYNKPKDRYDLFNNLKKAADDCESTRLRHKYADVCEFYASDDIMPLLNILEGVETNDVSVFNRIRKILDWIMTFLNVKGVLPVKFEGSNLSDCSRFLGRKEMSEFVPVYVQRSLHSCIDISNEGSHRLTVDEIVRNGNAPYLIRSSIYELLNILHWCSSIPNDESDLNEIKDKISAIYKESLPTSEETLSPVYEGIVEQDEYRNYHCGECLLNFRDMAPDDRGKHIRIYSTSENKNERTRALYKVIAFKANIKIGD